MSCWRTRSRSKTACGVESQLCSRLRAYRTAAGPAMHATVNAGDERIRTEAIRAVILVFAFAGSERCRECW